MTIPYTILAVLLVVDLFLFQCNIPETKGVELKDHIVKKPSKCQEKCTEESTA